MGLNNFQERSKKTMRRFELFRRFSFLIAIFVGFAVLFAPMAMAATVGFYAGTFDPPTQAEMGMVRCALGDTSFHRQCAQIGKSLSRIVVSVNESGDEDTLASTRERALMVKRALQK
jgi:hypothetical protein